MKYRTRSMTISQNGMVATSQPLAVIVGLDVLKSGGNAVDAAIAVNAMLGVVEPDSCGVGGDLFAIVWENKSQKLFGLNASGRAPYDLSLETFSCRGLKSYPPDGPMTWTVPGCVDGWHLLNSRFGTKSLKELLAPAIAYAEFGFPVSEVIADTWNSLVHKLLKWETTAKTFLKEGHAPQTGEVFHNPQLAKTLQLIGDYGRDAFYLGEISERMIQYSQKMGGFFSKKDFTEHTSDWVDPIGVDYRGYEIRELPPNCQGIAVLQMLNILEQFDIAALGHNNADYIHLFTESKKLVYLDRARYYGDPNFCKIPVKELISKDYARKQKEKIDIHKAIAKIIPGTPIPEGKDTVYLTVVDKDRNCVSLIQSIYGSFGSGMVPEDLGFILQNRGWGFSLYPDHPNCLMPHKRPFHTLIPAFVLKEGKPYFCFGVMGGVFQPQGQVQILNNLIDFKMNPQLAGDMPRFRHNGSPEPDGKPTNDCGWISVESGISSSVNQELREKGHQVEIDDHGYGGYQGILIEWKNNILQGGSESRKDGCAMGF